MGRRSVGWESSNGQAPSIHQPLGLVMVPFASVSVGGN